MSGLTFICPQPLVWDSIHRTLREAWEAGGKKGNPPPVPLILNGWVFTSDLDKQRRWQETLAWANEHSLAHLIPELAEGERYEVARMTRSYRLTFCPASYRFLWDDDDGYQPVSVLCPECGAVLQPSVDQYEDGTEVERYRVTIPSHDQPN